MVAPIMSPGDFWQDIAKDTHRAVRSARPRRMQVASISGPAITVSPLDGAGEMTETIPYLGMDALTIGDHVWVVRTSNGDRLAIGKNWITTPTKYTMRGPLLLPDGSEVVDGIAPVRDWRSAQYLPNPTGTSVQNLGFSSAATLDGNVVDNADDSAGPWLRHTTASTINTVAGMSSPFIVTMRAWEPIFIARIRVGPVISATRIWVGLTSATLDGTSAPNLHFAAFRYTTGTDDSPGAMWRCVTGDGSNRTATFGDAPVALSTSDVVLFRIECRATEVEFFINNTHVATIASNLPASTQPLGFQIRVNTTDAAAKIMRWGRAALLMR